MGVVSRLIACSCSLVSAEDRFEKTALTFASSSPVASSASIVLAKVAARGSFAIASTSLRCWATASCARRKCSGLMSWNGGTPNGVVHSLRSGLAGDDWADGCAHAGTASTAKTTRSSTIRLDMARCLSVDGNDCDRQTNATERRQASDFGLRASGFGLVNDSRATGQFGVTPAYQPARVRSREPAARESTPGRR
jgi:hypothetical protein